VRRLDRNVLDQCRQKIILALEIVIERGAPDAGRVGDILQAGTVETARGEQLGRMIEKLALNQRLARTALAAAPHRDRPGFGRGCVQLHPSRNWRPLMHTHANFVNQPAPPGAEKPPRKEKTVVCSPGP
jgi:hypothetical protein